jgi:hypothetical protein
MWANNIIPLILEAAFIFHPSLVLKLRSNLQHHQVNVFGSGIPLRKELERIIEVEISIFVR